MELVNILNVQLGIINKSKNEYRKLAQCIERLENQVEFLSGVWKEDAGEKYYIINGLNSVGKEMAKICTGYKSYTKNAEKLIDIIGKFEKVVGINVISVTAYPYKAKAIRKSNRTKVVMNTTEVKACGNNLVRLGNDVIDIQLKYKNITSKIDDIIANKLQGKITSLTKLNVQLDQQGVKLCQIGAVLIKISEKYETAEKSISNKALQLQNGKAVTYGDGTVSSVELKEKEGRVKKFPSANAYRIYEERGGLAGQDAKSDKEIIAWIKRRDNGRHGINNCSKFVQLKLKDMGIKTNLVNGGVFYQEIKKTKFNNCQVECIDGENALHTLVERAKSNGEPIYNVVISFPKATGNADPSWGHVVMIDKITADGYVYYSDNWYGSNMGNGWYKKKYTDFISFYSKNGNGKMLGAAHFVKNS